MHDRILWCTAAQYDVGQSTIMRDSLVWYRKAYYDVWQQKRADAWQHNMIQESTDNGNIESATD